MIERFMAWLAKLLKWHQPQNEPEMEYIPIPPPEPPISQNLAPQRVYEAAKANLGKHITLDSDVPEEVGCVEAVSYVLKEAGYTLPNKGIAGVNALIAWMEKQGFKEITTSSVGCIITAHSPDVNNPNFAHAGVCLKYGIASNTSANGRFTQNYSYSGWLRYFSVHGSQTRYFEPQ